MAKSSRAVSAEHRDQVVAATSRLLRERGEPGVRVQEAMASAGLTHGGFYKHFGSKDDLVGEAAGVAFGDVLDVVARVADEAVDPSDAWRRLALEYLSTEHRADVAGGCANAALAAESAHADPESSLRAAFTNGVHRTVSALTRLRGGDGAGQREREESVRALAVLVGSMVLARATAGDPLSDEFLAAGRAVVEAEA